MNEIVARVRDAIEVAIHEAGGFEHMSQEDGNTIARAAIEAMQEPTDAMLKAAWDEGNDNPRVAWKAMIKALLSDKSK